MENQTPFEWLIQSLNLHPSLAGRYIHISMSVVTLILITAASVMVWRKLKDTQANLLPDERSTIVNILEVLVEMLTSMAEDVMGERARKHIPMISIVFIYILICNLMSVVPWIRPPTENINTNLSCAIAVFIYYNAVGIRELGIRRYLRNMAGPVIWIAPLMLAIEIVSHIVRPISLSVRLFGNIAGDHMVLDLFSGLAPLVVPIIFMMMAIFIAFIQAFVFTLLSMIYISLATGGMEHQPS